MEFHHPYELRSGAVYEATDYFILRQENVKWRIKNLRQLLYMSPPLYRTQSPSIAQLAIRVGYDRNWRPHNHNSEF